MPSFESVVVGSELPVLGKMAGRTELVKYAAGSSDFNPLHYDPDFSQARDFGNNIVHGRWKYAALGELVFNWLEHSGRIVSIACEFREVDLAGVGFTCHGKVTAKHGESRTVELEVWVENDEGRVTTPGRATVVLDG